MKTPIYHVAFCKEGSTLVIEARVSIDNLSCEVYDYMGKRETTKKDLHAHRKEILKYAQEWKPAVYGKLTRVRVD